MTCAERRDRMVDHLYGLLQEGEAAELDRHVAACTECRAAWDAVKGRDALLDAWTADYRASGPIRVSTPRRRAGLIWAAAALLVALGTTLLFPAPFRYELVRGDAAEPLALGAVVTADGPATMQLGRAGRVLLEPGSRVTYRSGGQDRDHDLELAAGTLHADVQPTGRAFRVAVGDRTVEVQGTRFTIRRYEAADLAKDLGEEEMKTWNLASVSVALVTVTTGTVVLTGSDGRHPVAAGKSVLATPAGVEKVEAGESLATVRKVRDELLRAVTAREAKNRAGRTELEALRAKGGTGQLPPGATLQSLLAGLRAAMAKGDPKEVQDAVGLLGLLLTKDPAAFDGMLSALRETRDAAFATQLCAAFWKKGATMQARRGDLLKLFLAKEMPADVRLAIIHGTGAVFYSFGARVVADADAAQLLKAARELAGETGTAASIRGALAYIGARSPSPGSEAWTELQRYLQVEPDDALRTEVLQNFFFGGARRKPTPEVEGLLLDTVRGRYGAAASASQMTDPLLAWFSPENAASFAAAFRQAASTYSEPALRQGAAGQLGLLHLIQRSPEALEALRAVTASESDAAARARMEEVLRAADKGTLDLDTLMEKLQLQWNF